ncbi:MAG: bifunctional hydroxymethylpyrimidine kinase/phosphomethylpyrimidine kinase [Clostridia bacterium]|nr:bifunctional hydroxymethylpyrimidine kinase/phosphomethylpyrimidine kinase [Clostridia bacterium]
MKKVVGLGANVLDTLITCKTFPTEDKKTKAEGIVRLGGGPVGNALVVLAKLGVPSEMIGTFSDDTAGVQILAELQKFGVKTDRAVTVSGTSSFVSYILISGENGSRTCLFDRGTVPDDPSLVDFSAIDGADILHLDGNYMKSAIAAAKYAREKGVKVSLDAGGVYDGILELLPLIDILIPSAEFAMAVTGEPDAKTALEALYKMYSPEILVVTDGKNGGYYWENGRAVHYDIAPATVRDTNGAGDTFHGAFIAAYAKGKSVPEACDFASAVAAYKCKHIGARDYELNEDIAQNIYAYLAD